MNYKNGQNNLRNRGNFNYLLIKNNNRLNLTKRKTRRIEQKRRHISHLYNNRTFDWQLSIARRGVAGYIHPVELNANALERYSKTPKLFKRRVIKQDRTIFISYSITLIVRTDILILIT